MGYTHYFRQNRPATEKEWGDICTNFKTVMTAALLSYPFPIQKEADDPSPVQITNDLIQFNGIGNDGHETMILDRYGEGAHFCKTAAKLYDTPVMVLLLLAHHFAPGVWTISSDGGSNNWTIPLFWLNSLGLGKFSLPPDIEQKD